MVTNSVAAQGEPRLLINGQLVESSSGKRFDNVNPATEEVLGQTCDADPADMEAAIAAARTAFDGTGWSTDRDLRKRCLQQLQGALVDEKEALRAELVAEVGAPVASTYIAQLEWPLNEALPYNIGLIDDFEWERALPDSDLLGTSRRRVWKEPIGVVAAIVPWNFPFEVTINKLAPALAAGNTVILKPAPDTPWNATRLGRIVAERTDIPPGVLNVTPTSDNAIAETLVTDPRVDMVSFTGSTAVGAMIAQKCGARLARTMLELGGKSAMIVLDDADFAATLPLAAGICLHAGQGCAMTTRLLVPRSRYDEAVEMVAGAYAQVPYGDPQDPATLSGPQISARQQERVLSYIDLARQEGAEVVIGGGRPAHLPRGFFVEPTVLTQVKNSMRVAREEIFGPVLCIIGYEDEADAIAIANDSDYGLSGTVFSGSAERAMRVAHAIRTGSMGVNGAMWYGADAPYGGYKKSGIGRQCGIEGFNQYLETKVVAFP